MDDSDRPTRDEKFHEEGYVWIKYCLFASNILFLMVGTMVLALGAWLRTDSRFRDFLSERYRQIVQDAFWEAPTLYIFSYLLITLGGVMIVIALFGCCGAVQRSKMMLSIYAVILFLLMLFTLGCGIFILYKRDGIDVELQDALNYMVQHYYQGAGIIQESLDRLQQAFRCCGNAGCSDFAAFHQDPPRTCDIRCDGCHYRIWTALHIGFSVAIVVFLIVIVVQLVAVAMSLYMVIAIPKHQFHPEYYYTEHQNRAYLRSLPFADVAFVMTERTHSSERNVEANEDSGGASPGADSWLPSFVQHRMNERAGTADIGRGGDEFFRQLRNVGNAFLSRHQTSPTPQSSRDLNDVFPEQGSPGGSVTRSGSHVGGLSARRSNDTNGVTVIDVDTSSPSPLMNQTDELSEIDSEEANQTDEEVDFSTREGLIRGLRRVNQRMNQPDTPIYCLLYVVVFIPFLLLVLLKNIVDSIYESIAFLIIVGGHVFMSQLFSDSSGRGMKFWTLMGMCLFATYETLVHMDSLHFLKESLLFVTVPKSEEEVRFTSILYIVIVSNYVVKTTFLVTKLAVSIAPMFSEKRKRRLYQWLEYTSILYCNLLPFPQWLRYFNNVFFVMLYILLKFCLSTKMIRSWLLNTRCLFRLTTVGTIPSTEEIAKDDHCSICCSTFSQPIKLSCNHLFCEDCVSTWLDKQDTCPICRQKVSTEDNQFKNGDSQLIPNLY
ncbi:hypothetical protein QR680_002135 [Steinernema hermaphroditum]|uniref:RING-type domain-containing protein n=1 Tax=Steinernema hermaphroditum TaxID=289476 RepID=A0AA39H1F1_9BILA|nr:hypothetical protein QR680_002135 [Steinernema hermaphroditum]